MAFTGGPTYEDRADSCALQMGGLFFNNGQIQRSVMVERGVGSGYQAFDKMGDHEIFLKQARGGGSGDVKR